MGKAQTEEIGGWTEIANYLGKAVRTVQRYERELGLPVRRPSGKPSGLVITTKAELNAWVGDSPPDNLAPRRVDPTTIFLPWPTSVGGISRSWCDCVKKLPKYDGNGNITTGIERVGRPVKSASVDAGAR